MKLPKIGDVVTNEIAIALCNYYGLFHITKHIKDDPEAFKSWIFDGASMVPDRIASQLLHIPNLTEIALKHDLKYAYGIPGDMAAKLKADWEFGIDLLKDGADPAVAKLAVAAVDLFGNTKSGFSWGFALV